MTPLFLFTAAALAGEPPPEPPDGEVLLEAAWGGLRAPPGCHALRGEVTKTVRVGPFKDVEVHALSAELDQGTWGEVSVEVLSDSKEGMALEFHDPDSELELPFFPSSFGGMFGGGSQDLLGAGALLTEVLQDFDPETSTVTSMYDFIGDHKVFAVSKLQTVVRERRQREVRSYATLEMHTLQPRTWQVSMDRGVKVDGARISGVELRMSADAEGVPTGESVAGTVRLGLLAVRVRQEIAYTRAGDC